MAKNKARIHTNEGIEGLAANLLKEVIKAEMSMHDRQIEAWQWMAKNRPQAALIDRDILKGLPNKRYLAMDEVTLTLALKPVKLRFASRVKLMFKILWGKTHLLSNSPFVYEYCSADDAQAAELVITIKRHSDGTFKASHSINEQAVK